MKMNSYGWVFLMVLMSGILGWVGQEAGFSVGGEVVDGSTIGNVPAALIYIVNIAIFRVDGMPAVISGIFDFFLVLTIWILWRQQALSGGDS